MPSWSTRPQEFRYNPLPSPTSIRLVRFGNSLKHVKAKDEGHVHLVMDTVDLKDNPEFTALSYTWKKQHTLRRTLGVFGIKEAAQKGLGISKLSVPPATDIKEKANRRIYCNGLPMDIFENVYSALKEFSNSRHDGYFWIDLLCINQRETAEVIHQVGVMDKIYRSAKEVVVWLGPRISSSDEDGLKLLSKLAKSQPPWPQNPLFVMLFGDSFQAVGSELDQYESTRQAVQAAMLALEIANRSWFRRVWVVQELYLAHAVSFQLGESQVDPRVLSLICHWCSGNQGRGVSGPPLMQFLHSLSSSSLGAHVESFAATVQLYTRAEMPQGGKWDLDEWYEACRGRKATISKDFIFAGLSLVDPQYTTVDKTLVRANCDCDSASNHECLQAATVWPAIVPDHYHASDAEVMLNGTMSLLSHAPLENVLRHASRLRNQYQFKESMYLRERGDNSLDTLPSWVANPASWKSSLTVRLGKPYGQEQSCKESFATATSFHFPAQRPSISKDGKHLTIAARKLDNIAMFFSNRGALSQQSELERFAKFMFTVAKDFPPPSPSVPTKSSPFEQVALAMVAGRVGGDLVTPEQATTWLCESLESRCLQIIRLHLNRLEKMTESMEQMRNGEAATGLFSYHTNNKRWWEIKRQCDEARRLLSSIATTLHTLKSTFSSMPWPNAATPETFPFEAEWEEIADELREERYREASNRLTLELAKWRDNAMQSTFKTGLRWLEKFYGSLEDFRPVSPECRAYEDAYCRISQWGSLFVTSSHGLVGLGPRWIAKDDHVALVGESDSPFVFADELLDLQREAQVIREKMAISGSKEDKDKYWATMKLDMWDRLDHVEKALHRLRKNGNKRKRYVLVGEAYLEPSLQVTLCKRLQHEHFVIA